MHQKLVKALNYSSCEYWVCVSVCVCILKSLWFGKVWWVWESVVRVTLTQTVVFSVSRQWNSHFKSTTQCAYLGACQWPNHTMFKSFWLNCFLTRLPTALTLYINTVGAGSFADWQVWPHTAVQFLSSGPSRAVNLSIYRALCADCRQVYVLPLHTVIEWDMIHVTHTGLPAIHPFIRRARQCGACILLHTQHFR